MLKKYWNSKPGSWRVGLIMVIASIAVVIIKNFAFEFERESFTYDLIIGGITALIGVLIMFASTEKLVDPPPEMKLGFWRHRPLAWKIGIVIVTLTLIIVAISIYNSIFIFKSLSYLKGDTIFLWPLFFGRALMRSCSNKIKAEKRDHVS